MDETKRQRFERILNSVSFDFDKKLIFDAEFSEKINLPEKCYTIFQLQLEGFDNSQLLEEIKEFNSWVKKLSEDQRDAGVASCIMLMTITSIREPFHSQPLVNNGSTNQLTERLVENSPREFALVGVN